MTEFGTDILKALKRTDDSRSCIDAKRREGKSGREARKECREVYGSRLGNVGRQLGISPQLAGRVYANAQDQAKFLRNTPKGNGTANSFAFGGGGIAPSTKSAGFNLWYLLPLVLFVPAIRKLIGIK